MVMHVSRVLPGVICSRFGGYAAAPRKRAVVAWKDEQFHMCKSCNASLYRWNTVQGHICSFFMQGLSYVIQKKFACKFACGQHRNAAGPRGRGATE